MAESTVSLEDYGIVAVSNVPLQDELATYVRNKFEEARRNKQNIGIEDKLLRNLRANKCEYQPDEIGLLGKYNDVYMGIPALKARAAESWLTDIILNNIEKPWTLDPTPKPDLPEKLKMQVVDVLLAELPVINSYEALRDRARTLKSAANQVAYQEAEKASRKMETLISDQMTEGDWMQTFAEFIPELVAYPTAFIRAPVVVTKPQGAWDGNKYKIEDKSIPTTRTISAFDAYPAPNSTTTQNGDYFIERGRYSIADMHNFAGAIGFNEGNVRQVLERYPEGFALNLMSDSTRDALEDRNLSLMNSGKLLDTIIYNGKVPGRLLADKGILVKDIQKHYECEIYVVGDYVIRAVLNPNPIGTRPIYGTSYRKIPGSFWGQSVICLTYDVGRVCNAAARSLVRNMGYASGPVGEVVSERVSETEDPTDLKPYGIKLVGPDLSGTGAPAYKFHNIDSIASDLLNVFKEHMKIADDLSGIPSYVLGNPQVAGAGRTLGGLSMLMGNAAKGIKNVQLNIDRDVITGVVAGFFIFNMLTSDDDGIKADSKVVARGATGLLQRELAQTRTIEILQLLQPYITPCPNGEPHTIPQEGIAILLRVILKTTGLPIDDIIPDPKAEEKARDLLRSIGQEGNIPAPGQEATLNRGTSSPVELPAQSMPQLPAPLSNRPVAVNMPTGA